MQGLLHANCRKEETVVDLNKGNEKNGPNSLGYGVTIFAIENLDGKLDCWLKFQPIHTCPARKQIGSPTLPIGG
jgi:hypothetical protein